MVNVLLPLKPPFYLSLPTDWIGWVGISLFIGLVLWGLAVSYEADRNWKKQDRLIFLALFIGVLITTRLIGVQLGSGGALPIPGRPEEPRGPTFMFFLAVPWMLAGGLLEPFSAMILGALSGLLMGYYDTHSLFTAVEYACLALCFSAAVRQRYRTRFYRVIRQPLEASILIGLGYIPLFLASTFFATSGVSLAVRVDYVVTHLRMAEVAVGLEMVIGGLISEFVSRAYPQAWGRRDPLRPSPAESSIQIRFFFGTAPLVFLLLVTLIAGDWIVAGNSARQILRDRLSSTAHIASESLPFFLESGQNLIAQMASDSRLQAASADAVSGLLHQDVLSIAFFRQLYVFDQNGQPISGYPEQDLTHLALTQEEQAGVMFALKDVATQTYTVPPAKGENTAQVSFISVMKNEAGEVQGVLLGRSDLASNPFTKPIIQTFEEMKKQGESGMILDENGQILYSPEVGWLMTNYRGKITSTADFFDEAAPDGTRNLVFFQPVIGRSWSVVLTVPAQRTQQMALDIAVPMIILILFIALLTSISLRLSLRFVTASLKTLAREAGRIAHGQLDNPLPVQGVDEVGRLRQAFEQMRVSLKDRLEELNQLLIVSQGVASSLEMKDAVRPILDAALSGDACMARIVLKPPKDQDAQNGLQTRFGLGPANEEFSYLDDQILDLSRHHDRLVLTNLTRGRGLNFRSGYTRPGALIAVAILHDAQFFGTLWVAYEFPRTFSEEEVRFLSTLAGEAALAAANGRLYETAEIGRQRLEAVLDSTPDPVLVTDENNRLLMYNSAALQLPGFSEGSIEGQPIEDVVKHRELLNLLDAADEDHPSMEISFPNGKVYYATVSTVVAEGQSMGKACLLRDITHFKQLDNMKSDFVATVSHDLRSPLALMRGYATMLQMVGDLNDQQKGYVRKIISGVDGMSRLVNNLLDIGRIEAGVGLQLEMTPVAEMIERIVSSLQLQATQKNIQLSQTVSTGVYQAIEVDSALLQQALYNLVDNAIKYTAVGGQVQIKAHSRGDYVLFEVEDSGIGIAPLDQPRLFEKFYRGGQRDGSTAQRGTGLGLAIVKSVAERHRGRVWLESRLGKGSTFYLEIPASQKRASRQGEERQPVV